MHSEIVEEKIQKIAKEIQEANASAWTIAKIIKSLSEMKSASEKKLREHALLMLKEIDPNAAIIYERFSKMTVYTSNEKTKSFNRGNIVNSLLKETNISRSVAEKITTEVENQIKDSKIEFLTPSLIRELVNAKLISYGFEEVRDAYARVGEPVNDVRQKLQTAPYAGETTREYNILIELPKKARELHFNGTIHIEDLEGFSQRAYAYSFIANEKDTLEKTIFDAIGRITHNRKYFFIQPAIYGLTFACAGFVKNEAHAKKAAETIIESSKILNEPPLLSLELFTPSALSNFSEQRLSAAKIANYLLGQNVVVGVDSKYSLKLIEPEGKQFVILNNALEEYYPVSKEIFSPTQGIDLYVNINLEKIAGESESEFFESLKEVAEAIEELRKTKQALLMKRPYLKDFKISELKTAIGLTNLNMLAQNFTTSKQIEFAGKTYKEISKLFSDCLLFGLSSENVRAKFSETSEKEIFSQQTLGFDECLKEKKCCFTGKAATIKEVNELLDKKVKKVEFVGI